MSELTIQNIPTFDELSIKKLWSHFKNNQTLMKYMPDYPDKQLPERDFFFGVLSTLYPKETEYLIKAAYKARKIHYKKNEDKMIEVTPDVKAAIDSIFSYKSNHN